MKKLSECFKEIPESLKETKFNQFSFDSNSIRPSDVFFAIRGVSRDGHEFIEDVLKKNPAAIFCEEDFNKIKDDRLIKVSNTRKALAEFSAAYFSHPSRSLKVVGITGTSGKTTTSFLVESILRTSGLKTGLLGTVLGRFENENFDATHTTPNPIDLQERFKKILKSKGQAMVMEVSSHALEQYRVFGTAFDVVAFSNLSPEHLDYHKDMDDYFRSKKSLFTREIEQSFEQGKNPVAVINDQNEYGKRLKEELDREKPKLKKILMSEFEVDIQNSWSGLEMKVQRNEQSFQIRSQLIGQFNVENILVALGCAIGLGHDSTTIEEGISQLEHVPGRLEFVSRAPNPIVIVDYAHKPDALNKVLDLLGDMKKSGQKLHCLFGCGGDRDRSKRALMGAIASQKADVTWVTSDNPRTEDPMAIIQEIMKGIDQNKPHHIEPDRMIAIESAVSQMGSDDILLIAGKGHETYQIIGTEKRPMDDRLIAKQALER